MIYFVADTHFSHANVILYCSRPFQTVELMNESLINNWNSIVKENDTVYHLGDFAMGKSENIMGTLQRLNGKKHLVLGNHDKYIRKNKSDFIGPKLFESISPILEIYLSDTYFVLNHYSMRVWNKSHKGSIHLFAHSHGSLPPYGKSVDVGVDCKYITSEYRPISIDEIINFMENREIKIVDHHKTSV